MAMSLKARRAHEHLGSLVALIRAFRGQIGSPEAIEWEAAKVGRTPEVLRAAWIKCRRRDQSDVTIAIAMADEIGVPGLLGETLRKRHDADVERSRKWHAAHPSPEPTAYSDDHPAMRHRVVAATRKRASRMPSKQINLRFDTKLVTRLDDYVRQREKELKAIDQDATFDRGIAVRRFVKDALDRIDAETKPTKPAKKAKR